MRNAAKLLSAVLLATFSLGANSAWAGESPPADTASATLSGPVVAVGFSEKGDVSMYSLSLGYRHEQRGPDFLDAAARRHGSTIATVLEPLLTLFAGDRESFDLQLVPMLRWQGTGQGLLRPWIEGGVGIAWSDLRGLNLGSRILFSDQVGVGFDLPTPGGKLLAVGYRLRHLSHAGLWADANSGINTHFVLVTLR
ncbi:MAG: acyloxyacyl hydrolase [Deltaproteobacteria bacterium]|nr:acyloxyacyl hydrolase [Deltaproteobacteria bacterium]